jgi:ferric-dicitrate binding protein FerR (iron transport regulator)
MNQSRAIDDLLTAFFQSEVPSPWPPAPKPERNAISPAERLERRTLARSRAALAVSLAAMLIGGWWLAKRAVLLPGRPATLEGTTATRPAELRPGK